MNKVVLAAGILIVLIAAGSAYVLMQGGAGAGGPMIPAETGNAAVGANGSSTIVAYTDDGFAPVSAAIEPGATVTWTNESSHPLWVRSSTSSNEDCALTEASAVFNECASIASGGSWSHTFIAPGTFPYVNAQRDGHAGTIIVSGEASAAGPIRSDAILE